MRRPIALALVLAILAILALTLSGCSTLRNLRNEASCGFGRDYVCVLARPGELVCGCVAKDRP